MTQDEATSTDAVSTRHSNISKRWKTYVVASGVSMLACTALVMYVVYAEDRNDMVRLDQDLVSVGIIAALLLLVISVINLLVLPYVLVLKKPSKAWFLMTISLFVGSFAFPAVVLGNISTTF